MAVDAKLPLPMVRREGVERGVVQRGNHFGDRLLGIGAGDGRRPRFLLSRTELGDEPLPLHVEFHVRPRHSHVMRALQHPVLANLRHVHAEAAAHFFGDRHLEQALCAAGRGPEPLRDLVSMLDLDAGAPRVVAGSPEQPKRLARLEAVLLGGHQLWQANDQALGRRVEHLQRVDRLDRFAEAIRGLEHRAVHADRQPGLDLGQALGVGLDFVRGDRLAKRPRLRVGAIDLRLGRAWPSAAAEQPRPLDRFWLLDRVDSQRALGRLRHAGERLGRDVQFHRLGHRLPRIRRHRRLQGGVANRHARGVAARLATAVGYVGDNAINEGWLTLFRNAGVRHGVELDDERAVRLGLERPVRDLPLLRTNRAAAPVMPAPPDRPACLPRDAEFALGRADRRAGVVGRPAIELDGLAELGRLLRLAQFDKKLGPLVLLHAEAALSMRRLGGRDAVVAGEPIPGRGEAA